MSFLISFVGSIVLVTIAIICLVSLYVVVDNMFGLLSYMDIVSFGRDRYAIRRGWFPWTYKYADLNDLNYWWKSSEPVFYKFCIGSYEQCLEHKNKLITGYGNRVL